MSRYRKKRSRSVRKTDPTARPASGAPVRRYLGTFAAAALGCFAVYWITDITGKFQSVNELNAILSGGLLRLLGVATIRSDTVLQFSHGGMEVISECSGIYAAILFAAAVLAFPTTWRARAWGLFLGGAAIFAINVVRLVTVGLVIVYQESLFPLVHEYLWQILFVLVVAALYALWIDKLTGRPLAAEEATP